MNKTETLEQLVREQYAARHPGRNGSADWIYDNHVLIVAKFAEELASEYSADVELARAGALLHDIADTVMSRAGQAEEHERRSMEMARHYMAQAGYSEDEVALVVDDAIRFHSCHGDERPASIEGRVLATADAKAHFKSEFYSYMTWKFAGEGRSFAELKGWALKKLERDYRNKIQFDEVRQGVASEYEVLNQLFSAD